MAAGDNIGRGTAPSIYFKDESAFTNNAEAIDAALSQTSNRKIDRVRRMAGGQPVLPRWRTGGKDQEVRVRLGDDPRKDDAWYQRQCESLDPVIGAGNRPELRKLKAPCLTRSSRRQT